MFSVCKCNFKQAIYNIKQLLEDEIVIKCYQTKHENKQINKFFILYKIGKYNHPVLIVIIAKLMLLSNPLYRLLQQKKRLKY